MPAVLLPDSVPAAAPEVVLPDSLLDTFPESLPETLPDSLAADDDDDEPDLVVPVRDIRYWTISEFTGEMTDALPDTFLTDYFNRTNVEGLGTAISYTGNLGSPVQSRIFSERENSTRRARFIFSDNFYPYEKRPEKFEFINTKIPATFVSYQTGGSQIFKEERFRSLLTTNLGRNLNIGVDFDYIYARGFYSDQAAKRLDWVFFANYVTDHHQLHAFYNPSNITNTENGGIEDDEWISHPDAMGTVQHSRQIPFKLSATWNNQQGKRAFVNYRYNFGKQQKKHFVPVASVIYTLDYQQKSRAFYTDAPDRLADYYADNYHEHTDAMMDNDSLSYWLMHNTVGLSLREGFAEWAKWDVTAYLTHEAASYTLMDTHSVGTESPEQTVLLGGELAKNKGKYLRYSANGQIGILGDSKGDISLAGNIKTRIPILGDTAAVTGYASFSRNAPTFYENTYHSKYFWWDEDFDAVNHQRIGGELTLPHTKTKLGMEIDNMKNYIYFDGTGYPKQYTSNIQVLMARWEQNVKLGILHWNTQLVYQKSSEEVILPLPELAGYSSLYIDFKIAKVLTVQLGGSMHYWTSYYAPSYEPATQQFKLQKEGFNEDTGENYEKVKVGNYPLINGFINCHLKQTRFFVEWYNFGTVFLTNPPNYFSLPHYPVNPSVIKMGLSVHFIN
ncbi:hypothetical protein AGMMS49965_11350 [Bacteroidia bacterium]|nr:hypothetical protein AGMMS49965_11350 [Bacteroidia bacterium]